MDTLIHHASKGITTPDRMSSHERLSLPPSPAPPSPPPRTNTMATTTPDPHSYTNKLKGARTAFMADDFLTATKLAYELLEDGSVPFGARAQAALIVTNYDHYPGNKPIYAEAVQIVESIRAMDQEQVDPNYKSMEQKIEAKRDPSLSSEEVRPLRMETSQIEGEIAGRGLSGIDEQDVGTALQNGNQGQLDRDIGMKLRQQDRAQADLDGGAEDKGEERDGKENSVHSVREINGRGDAQAAKVKSVRECSCIVV